VNKPRKLRREQERHFSAHHMLLNAASHALEAAKAEQPGWFNEALAAITFSALAMEAMGNAFGDRIVPEWKDFESASPPAKLRLLAERLGVTYDRKKEPWTTIWWLSKFRNRIAHPKPELLVEEKLIDESEYDKREFVAPESKLEREITIANARRAVDALQDVKRKLCEKLDPEERFSLFADGWSGTTELQDPN
jgi:hypothetical protein